MIETFEGADDLVILVDDFDHEIGFQDKLSVHQQGFYIEHFQYLYLIPISSLSCNRDQIINIILLACGLIPAVVTLNLKRIRKKLVAVD